MFLTYIIQYYVTNCPLLISDDAAIKYKSGIRSSWVKSFTSLTKNTKKHALDTQSIRTHNHAPQTPPSDKKTISCFFSSLVSISLTHSSLLTWWWRREETFWEGIKKQKRNVGWNFVCDRNLIIDKHNNPPWLVGEREIVWMCIFKWYMFVVNWVLVLVKSFKFCPLRNHEKFFTTSAAAVCYTGVKRLRRRRGVVQRNI